MPSVAFYTFTHAHGFLNCATVSRDAAIVAGGFADSAVRVWDMNKAVPGGADVYETDPESRARRAAKDAEMDAPAAERGEGGGDATMADAEKQPVVEEIGVQNILNADTRPGPANVAGDAPTRGARLARPTPSTEYVGHASAVHGVSLSPGNEFLLSCSRDTTVRVWSLELETCLAAYRGHEAPVWDVRWCYRGHYFATASNDKTARVWAMDSPTPRRVMTGHLADVDCVAWHPNVNYIATGSADKTVRMWDVATGECVRVFVGHVSGVRALALSPDGKSLASASEDGQVLAWDLGTARQTHAFVGHRGPVYSLDYAGGGAGICSRAGGRTRRSGSGTLPSASTSPTRRRRDKKGTKRRRSRRRKRGDRRKRRARNRRPCARCRSRGGTCSWPWARARLPRRRREQVSSSDSFRGTSSRVTRTRSTYFENEKALLATHEL